MLLQFCILFYLVELGEHFKLYKETVSKVLLIVGVTFSSLFLYFYNGGMEGNSSELGWCFERMGLVWGLILLWHFTSIKRLVTPTVGKIIVLTVVCLILGITYLKFKHIFFWGEYLTKIILGIAIIYLLFIVTSKRKWGNKVAYFLGDISYEVYLSHGFIMALVAKYIPSLTSGEFVLTSVIITIFFSWLIHLIDKPIVKALRYKG